MCARVWPCIVLLAALALEARASITFGPWTFDDQAFGDQASQIDGGSLFLYCGATNVQDALAGFSPKTMLANIGFGGNGNHFQIEFDDILPVNLAGPDLVFFEARYSADAFEVAVRLEGATTFTPFLPFTSSQFQNTGFDNGCGGLVWGLPIDLDAYGLASGSIVDAIQFRGITAEGDPVMAGVLNGSPPCLGALGSGCPGSGGVTPTLGIAACPAAGQPFSLSLVGGLGASTAILVFAPGPSTTPLPGGCTLDIGPLVPFSLTIPLGGVGPGQGAFTLGTVLPATITPGSLGLQAFVLDPAPPLGASATPGYVLTFG